MITKLKLKRAEAAFQASAVRYERNRERRNALFNEAIAEGWSLAQIADATGLARSRVGQLTSPRRASDDSERV